MGLKAGIVGLPNVGKSTLFNAITNSHVEAANYPFATINPNTGVVNVPDERLKFLSNLFKPERTIPATVEFYDIAGLVRVFIFCLPFSRLEASFLYLSGRQLMISSM